jgi:hypothetical protein
MMVTLVGAIGFPAALFQEVLRVKEMAGPRFEDDSLPVRAAVFASGRTALMSTASVSTPDHLRGPTLASVVPAGVFQECPSFGAEDHNNR